MDGRSLRHADFFDSLRNGDGTGNGHGSCSGLGVNQNGEEHQEIRVRWMEPLPFPTLSADRPKGRLRSSPQLMGMEHVGTGCFASPKAKMPAGGETSHKDKMPRKAQRQHFSQVFRVLCDARVECCETWGEFSTILGISKHLVEASLRADYSH